MWKSTQRPGEDPVLCRAPLLECKPPDDRDSIEPYRHSYLPRAGHSVVLNASVSEDVNG